MLSIQEKFTKPPSGALLLFLLVLIGATAPTRAAAQDKSVAIVQGQTIYEKDVLAQIQSQLYKIRKEEYELRLKTVEDLIGKRLLKEEAAKHGVTEEEWLRQQVDSKAPEPTQDEIDQEFAQQMSQGAPAGGIEEIEERLKQENIQQAREDYLAKLRERAGVKINLLPPTMDIAYDPARVRGNPDAKITIVEFSDFQCPYCLQAFTTMKNLLKKYQGKIKLAYRDLPLIEENGGPPGSADAARCAGEQGKFWEFHDLLFQNQDEVGTDAFEEYADALHLDAKQFTACLESGKFKASIRADYQEGLSLGITGTPAFFINGIPISGARPQPEFESIIDAQLAAVQR